MKSASSPIESAETPSMQLVATLVFDAEDRLLVVFNIKDLKKPLHTEEIRYPLQHLDTLKDSGLRIEPNGGKIETGRGEKEEEASRREGKEELGIIQRCTGKLGVYASMSPRGEPLDVHTLIAEIIEGTPTEGLEPTKIGGFGWFTLQEIGQMAAAGIVVPNLMEALGDIRKYLERRRKKSG